MAQPWLCQAQLVSADPLDDLPAPQGVEWQIYGAASQKRVEISWNLNLDKLMLKMSHNVLYINSALDIFSELLSQLLTILKIRLDVFLKGILPIKQELAFGVTGDQAS